MTTADLDRAADLIHAESVDVRFGVRLRHVRRGAPSASAHGVLMPSHDIVEMTRSTTSGELYEKRFARMGFAIIDPHDDSVLHAPHEAGSGDA